MSVPDDRHVHVFVPVGSVHLDGGGELDTGDNACVTNANDSDLVASDRGAEVLIWAMA